MDETLRFFIGVTLFISVILYERFKNRSGGSVSKTE